MLEMYAYLAECGNHYHFSTSLNCSTWQPCCCLFTKLDPTLCDPMNCNQPGYSVHGDSSSKIIGVGGHALFQGIFLSQGLNPCLLGLLHCRWILYCWAMGEAFKSLTLLHSLQVLSTGVNKCEHNCSIITEELHAVWKFDRNLKFLQKGVQYTRFHFAICYF